MSNPIKIDSEEALLEHFGKPMPITVPKLPPDYEWLPVNVLAVGYATPQKLKVVRVQPTISAD